MSKTKESLAARWIIQELSSRLKADNKSFSQSPLTPKNLSVLIRLELDGVITSKTAKELFEFSYLTGRCPKEIAEEKGLFKITDSSELLRIVKESFGSSDISSKPVNWSVGQIMKATNGRADPVKTKEILMKEYYV